MAKYPLDTCSNGGTNLDDSLTSLNWLQNLNIMKITSPTPPPSPVPFGNYASNEINKNMKVNPNAILNVSCAPPQCKMEPKYTMGDSAPTSLNGEAIDYKTNPYVKPPYSYATLICMAMKETKKSKITLSSIYNWITENFMYYRLADPSWQNSIRHNLSLNKCFQKVPRRKDEPGKGGFWRINPDYNDMIDNGVFKKRRNSREGPCPPPMKKIKKEPEDDYLPSCHGRAMKQESVVHFSNDEHESLKGDFNWTSILHQDIEIAGIKIKTEDLLDGPDSSSSVPSDPMSPPSSECSSDNFSIEDLFTQHDLSQDVPFDYTTNDPLDLTINGSHISPPEWWSEDMNTGDHVNIKHSNGLHTPIIPSSPVQEHDHLDGHPWAESSTFADIAEAFDVDNLFDLENIPSPKLS